MGFMLNALRCGVRPATIGVGLEGQARSVSGPAPALSRDDRFGLVNSVSLGRLYQRDVFVSPTFIVDHGKLTLPIGSHRIFVPVGLDESMLGLVCGLDRDCIIAVADHDALMREVTASAPGVSAIMLFCPPEILSPDLVKMIQALEEDGFVSEGFVRPLTSVSDGVAFVRKLASVLPAGWDLIDACELLDFGPWEDKKGVNATLRCFGMKDLRPDENQEKSRMKALFHPFSNRANVITSATSMLASFSKTDLEDTLNAPLQTLTDRLIVETVFIMEYLKNNAGLQAMAREVRGNISSAILDRIYSLKNLLESILKLQTECMIGEDDLSQCLLNEISAMYDRLRTTANEEKYVRAAARGLSLDTFLEMAETAWGVSSSGAQNAG